MICNFQTTVVYTIINDLEDHAEFMNIGVQDIVNNIKELNLVMCSTSGLSRVQDIL